MEDNELLELWKASEKQLEKAILLNNQSWVLNDYVFVSIQQQKARKKLISLLLSKLLGIVLGVAFIWFIAGLLYDHLDRPAVVISTGAIILITSVVVVDYLIQFYLACTLNFHESILQSQKQLVYIELSIIRSIRISFLQLPCYTFFYIDSEVINSATASFWIFQFCFTGMFVFIALFFYINIAPRKLSKKWVRKLVDDAGGKSIKKTVELLNQINDFQKDLITTNQA